MSKKSDIQQVQKHLVSLDGQSRRAFLRAMFYTAGAVGSASWLVGCGGGDSVQGDSLTPTPADPVTPVVPTPPPEEPGLVGRFADLGPLEDPDIYGVRSPAGFTTRVVAINNELPQPNGMAAASPTPGGIGNRPWHIFPDGAGVVPRDNGGWIYISNSEVPGIGSLGFTFPALSGLTNIIEQFTPGLAQVGTLVFDPDGTIVDSYTILTGTTFNCAGCVTPWKTWLSCEEFPNGQVWECDPFQAGEGLARPTLGFFSHEAVAIDPNERLLYLTEDMPDGRFYRWVPDPADWPEGAERAALQAGRLQVMAVGGDGVEGALTSPQPITWIDARNPHLPQNEHRIAESTAFDGGEGVWYFNGIVYFATKGDNRIWAVDIAAQTVEIIYDLATAEAPNNILSGVDNLFVTNQGDVLVAEDGGDMQIVAILPDRTLKPIVQVVGQDASEIAGVAFSPDGRRMYFTSDRGGRNGFGGFTNGLGMVYEVLLPDSL
ncbi:alkaline phosphatase PhoX [Marinobacter mobilis]|uniref:Secreted phosphatase, PhoX family n=1 Tax=Marinobacter mobilis TaxID=488533 RepID=A0A1H2SGH8_9GAMM|nr:alkaline phosphatase PhoX [Marinobacter mobilis]SDW30615.1 Secreted phosphatase, PhoX family [Marinobacter mobilis]